MIPSLSHIFLLLVISYPSFLYIAFNKPISFPIPFNSSLLKYPQFPVLNNLLISGIFAYTKDKINIKPYIIIGNNL